MAPRRREVEELVDSIVLLTNQRHWKERGLSGNMAHRQFRPEDWFDDSFSRNFRLGWGLTTETGCFGVAFNAPNATGPEWGAAAVSLFSGRVTDRSNFAA